MPQRSALAAIVGMLTLAGLQGCGGGDDVTGRAQPVAISGLIPGFDPAQTRYVSRCGRRAAPIEVRASDGAEVAVGSAPARTGDFRVESGSVLPGEDFGIEVRRAGSRASYSVRCLPADFPRWRFQAIHPTAPGLFVVAFRPTREARPWVIVFDHDGAPRWWYSPATRALWAKILSDGTVAWARSFGDGYGLDPRMAHEVRTVSGRMLRAIRTRGSATDGHELQELANGNVIVDTYAPAGRVDLERFGGPAHVSAVFAEIQEIDRRGRVVWRWNSRQHIDLPETGRWWRNVIANAKASPSRATVVDPVHINSIEPRGDELVVSMRHTDAVYGIERSSGEITWKLGGTETRESLRLIGDPAQKVFGGQHDARIGDDGTLTVYDNGKDRPRRPRAAFYRLHLRRGAATYLGQLNDPRVSASHCCGSARPLDGGGWLVSWGDNHLVTGFDRRSRIAFRLSLPTSSFRAVPVPSGATSIAALDRGLEQMEP